MSVIPRSSTRTDTEIDLPSLLPQRRPMAAVRRVALFEREIRVNLSSPALELLFELAEVLSEGQREPRGYFGSTMLTIDLAKAAGAVRDDCDAAVARRVAELIAKDARFAARAKLIARGAAEQRAGGPLARLVVDLRVRAAGTKVHVDLDVEGGE